MAKIGVFYGVCPLIDDKSFLGVSEDVNSSFAIITLGKNIAVRYKLSDQKQVHSWSTKERLTSGVIYDKVLQQYACAFNHNSIRVFGNDCENLDTIKKHKFQSPIHRILNNHGTSSIVIYKNGTISSLAYAINTKKDKPRTAVINAKDIIEDQMCIEFNDTHYVGLLVKTENNKRKFVMIALENENLTENRDSIKEVSLEYERKGIELSGYIFSSINDKLVLLTLWSNRFLHSYTLTEDFKFPGRKLSVIEELCCKQQVAMISLGDKYIALYGANSNLEGASLLIYNIQFNVVQCKQPFKIFTSCAKIWLACHSLLFAVGNNLAAVPYELATEQLVALVGSHKLDTFKDVDPDIKLLTSVEIADWGIQQTSNILNMSSDIPKKVEININELIEEGQSERVILEAVLPGIVNNKDIKSMHFILENFKEIPEHLIVKLLLFFINVENSLFEQYDLKPQNDLKCYSMKPETRIHFVNKILNIRVNENIILNSLRSEVTLADTLTIIQHINEFVTKSIHEQPELLKNMIDWACFLLDSQYQNLLLSKNNKVVDVIVNFQKNVLTQLSYINNLIELRPLVDAVAKKRNMAVQKNPHSKWYSVDNIEL